MPDEPMNLDADWRQRIRRGPTEAMVRDLDVSVHDVLLALSRGVPGKQVVADHPGLRGTDLRACLAYAAEIVRTAPPSPEIHPAEAPTISGPAPSVQAQAAEAETVAPQAGPPDQLPTIAPAAAALASGPVQIPGYEILEELGRGGMGVVYKARAIQLDRVVALKMILAAEYADADMLERFRREAQAAAQLPHAGIVQVYEVGEHDGRPYIVQEFVTGGSLASWLDDKPWSATQAAELVEALAHGVQAAHDHDIIHRDLKPENVLMTEDGQPKIADFGLAKRLDVGEGKTRTGAILGTPSYMAPEQAGGRSREIGPGADVYALGAILYRLMTGRPPFQGAVTLDVLMQVLEQEPEPVRRLNAKAPRDLETITLKCLAKSQQKRYASAKELADDLRRFLSGESIRGRRQSWRQRVDRWVQRRPGALALRSITVLILLILVLATSIAYGLMGGGWSGILCESGALAIAAFVAAALACVRWRPLIVSTLVWILIAVAAGVALWYVPPTIPTSANSGQQFMQPPGFTFQSHWGHGNASHALVPNLWPAPIFFGTCILAGLLAAVFTAALRSRRAVLFAVGFPLFVLVFLELLLLLHSEFPTEATDARATIVLLSFLPAETIPAVLGWGTILLSSGLVGLVYGGIVCLVRRTGGDPVDILCGAVLGSGLGGTIGGVFAGMAGAILSRQQILAAADGSPSNGTLTSVVVLSILGTCILLGALVWAYCAGAVTRGVRRPAQSH